MAIRDDERMIVKFGLGLTVARWVDTAFGATVTNCVEPNDRGTARY
jgi:hypothetical protein